MSTIFIIKKLELTKKQKRDRAQSTFNILFGQPQVPRTDSQKGLKKDSKIKTVQPHFAYYVIFPLEL